MDLCRRRDQGSFYDDEKYPESAPADDPEGRDGYADGPLYGAVEHEGHGAKYRGKTFRDDGVYGEGYGGLCHGAVCGERGEIGRSGVNTVAEAQANAYIFAN